ncbi:MAG: AcrB/AcrD/AcrF family protein [Pseudomonadales bacterium]|nr:efflux RND transporter permease subunit [Pseudomonadales bacterium]NIX06802.1 AcrB/AcrD/AcrF family protein [Pseudomonadales bacterium]
MNGPIAWFARNHIAANLLLGVMVLAGLITLPFMPQKSFPDLDYNLITVSVRYLGAAPEETEDGVCIRVEEAIDGIEGIERIRSTASEGMCLVNVELFENTDGNRILGDVKNRVDAIETFPQEAEKPIITLVSSQRPVVDIAVTGPSDERELKAIGQQVRDEIAALPGVTQVELAGMRPYEISIEISEATLRRYGLTFDEVANAVRSASLDLPGGVIKTEGGEILLRTEGQAYWGQEFEDLVILTRGDGTRVFLRDIATVVDGFEDTDERVWFNSKPAALIEVSRVGTEDILDITRAVKAYMTDSATRLPEGVELTIWNDNSEFMRDRLDTLMDSARQGFLLVLLLLALFLRPRLAFWVSVGVPVAFMGAIFVANLLGLSIDGISTFGFILVLGILVDDAVVVGERVYSLQSRAGPSTSAESLVSAAIDGTRQVSVPVIFGVLTTITAFFPLMFGPGTTGQIQSVISMIVLCCLTFSLIESQLVLPAHLGHRQVNTAAGEVGLLLVPLSAIVLLEIAWDLRSFIALAAITVASLVAWHLQGGFANFAARVIRMQQRFSDSLERAIQYRFRRLVASATDARYVTAAAAIAVFMVTIGVLAGGHMPFSYFPSIPADRVSAKLTMPMGTPARVTERIVESVVATADAVADDLAEEFPDRPPVLFTLAAVGGHPVSQTGLGAVSAPVQGNSGGHMGEVTLQLTPSDQREVGTLEVARRWRGATGPIPDAVEFSFVSSSFSVGAEIDIQLAGPELDELAAVAAKIREGLAAYPGVIDITDSFRSGKGELKLDILPAGEALGLSLGALASQVRQAFYGEEIQRIQRGRDDVRVMLRYTETERRSLGALDDMRIRTRDGSEVPFATVAQADLGRGFSAIKRTDGQRVVNVTADIDRTVITANEVLADFGAGPLQAILRDHPRVTFSLEGTRREQEESVASLFPLFGLALAIIYALLAIPLRSYAQPLIIMSVIPFAMAGAIWGHVIMKSLGLLSGIAIMSVMGFVAASGVVVNSSLVLVHGVNARRREGMSVKEAVVEAAVTRCRPILLTSLTTFAGLSPLLLNQSVQAQVLIPMATSVAWGVIFATVVTLLFVPAGYLILDDLQRIGRRRAPATSGDAEAGASAGR